MTNTVPSRVRPFACGTQSGDWRMRNCERCSKAWSPERPEELSRCDIDLAICEAYFDDGTLPRELALRMGWSCSPPHPYTWDCPERTPPNE